MSGGHFDYNQYKIGQIADEIEQLIETNNSDEIDQWGQRVGRDYPEEIVDKFREALVTLKKAEIMAQRIDWLVSGDDGEETFLRRWRDELRKLSV